MPVQYLEIVSPDTPACGAPPNPLEGGAGAAPGAGAMGGGGQTQQIAAIELN